MDESFGIFRNSHKNKANYKNKAEDGRTMTVGLKHLMLIVEWSWEVEKH